MRFDAWYLYMKYFTIVTILAASQAVADCPPVPDIQAEQDQILAQVKVSPNERTARLLSNDLWALWTQAPDDHAQELLDIGMNARGSYDFDRAIEAFDRLTSYCPDYAEGYNQRAFVNFLRENYEEALVDLDLALERQPKHVAAIAGKALTLIGLKRDTEAQRVLRQALALNPWLSERRFLTEPDAKDL